MIISQSSETITSHHHGLGAREMLEFQHNVIVTLLQGFDTLATFPVILSKLAEAGAFLLTFVFFLLCFSFYSFTKPFSLTQKTGQF